MAKRPRLKHAPVVSDDVVKEACDRIWNALGPSGAIVPDETLMKLSSIAAPGKDYEALTDRYREELARKVRECIGWKLFRARAT